jgi:ATPase family associated with various cellular activities (AAA)
MDLIQSRIREDMGQSENTFEYLATNRKLVQEFCRFHGPTLECFKARDLPIFRLIYGADEPDKFRHITSTATCYSSLDLYPKATRPETDIDFDELGNAFALEAIKTPVKEWKSDEAAQVYCTCRGLPYVLSKLQEWHTNIDPHLDRIYYQLKEDPARFAVGEAPPPDDLLPPEKKKKLRDTWYKPNAYHTFWALEIIRELRDKRFDAGRENNESFRALSGCEDQMRLWARQQLGLQVALHSGNSSVLDSDQLAWSLAIIVSRPRDYQSNLSEQDFIRQAFKCLFQTQEKVGTWRHYAPLFHYPSVGNAYCYVFETFTTLLTLVLKPEAGFLREVLREYAPRLIDLWQYSRSTKTEISTKSDKSTKAEISTNSDQAPKTGYGWSSGHRIQPNLESWATASVFAYAQALRRVIGLWTREEALKSLNYKVSFGTRPEAVRKLRERVGTWTHPNLANLLGSMFVNPILDDKGFDDCDPDEPLFSDDVARSAIFFGPPGTGKTSLVSSLAQAIGWKYIELHPSHFVSEGLPNVQHTADIIFSKLMELDHAVILFDEIDELVRERELEPDQFGRFLTTSMLPRLAELWKARKVMYFVGTNHIEYFDRAITRSERFDAIIFLSPPAFENKRDRILKLLDKKYSITTAFSADLNKGLIDAAMPRKECTEANRSEQKAKRDYAKAKPLPETNVLMKFALVRWDELNDIALHLSVLCSNNERITPEVLAKALRKVRDSKSRSLGEYCRFESDPREYEWFDSSRNASWIVTNGSDIDLAGGPLPKGLKQLKDLVAHAPIGDLSNLKVRGYEVEEEQAPRDEKLSGTIRLKKVGASKVSAPRKLIGAKVKQKSERKR